MFRDTRLLQDWQEPRSGNRVVTLVYGPFDGLRFELLYEGPVRPLVYVENGRARFGYRPEFEGDEEAEHLYENEQFYRCRDHKIPLRHAEV